MRRLGVSRLYLSPALQARRGSTHGYDVTDPRRISEDLRGEAAFRALAVAGLRIVLDIVPNHMAASDENPFWSDEVLRGRFLDIDPAGEGRCIRVWNLALVDPDNRRPVDWERRRVLLDEVAGGAAPRRETAKMFLIHRALAPRARRLGDRRNADPDGRHRRAGAPARR